MKCIKCKTNMTCYDDVCYTGARIDFKKCSKCNSEADIIYNSNNEIVKVEWRI